MLGPSKYSFWWTPKPVATGRRSMRAQKGSSNGDPYRNVMYDKRVIRGSNYGATSILAELDPLDRAAQVRRRNALRKKIVTRNQRNVLGTPPPVMGRRHEIIQTDQYLEELLEHPPVRTADTQTDLFLEQPPTPPHFKACKIGIDVGTSIEDDDLVQQNVEEPNLEEPLIERFVEACILETAHEVECEENQIANPFLDDLVHQSDDDDKKECEELLSSFCNDEVTQIVDSQEILGLIIEEIIKQRSEAGAAEAENALKNEDSDNDESKTI